MPGGFIAWSDLREQLEIEESLSPDPAWRDVAHRLQRLSAERTVRAVSRAAQRARRGWSDEDLWDLDVTLCRTLGAQLTAFAAQRNGFPGDGTWGEHGEDWYNAMTYHGSVLSLSRAGLASADPEAAQARICDSLCWVADHHQHLWS
jgi:hypothetical protein